MNSVKLMFKERFGVTPESETLLAGAGSGRRYVRLSAPSSDGMGEVSAVATYGNNAGENRSFVSLSRAFRSGGVNVPEVYDVSDDGLCYLQSDLGNVSLLDVIKSGDKEKLDVMMQRTISQLVRLQLTSAREWERSVTERPFGRRLVMWDLNYFKYEFLKPSGVVFSEDALEDEFESLCDRLMSYPKSTEGFMMRDCQSRNVMVHDGDVWLIDFQGGRRGPAIYDIVSLLWQAKAGFDHDYRLSMLLHYAEIYSEHSGVEADILLGGYEHWVLFRLLQVMGAYGLRGLVEKKSHFIESIPSGLRNLSEWLAGDTGNDYPELRRVVGELVRDPRFGGVKGSDGLTVSVFSFSYKHGSYPEDLSGNGGGFMFDCRSMHNPGRYPEYRSLTGLDESVISFLESKGEVQRFLEHASALVCPAVERYHKRGFTNLQVGFGCTGGQHRSVYCAQHLAELLAERYPQIRVRLCHREQKIEAEYFDNNKTDIR